MPDINEDIARMKIALATAMSQARRSGKGATVLLCHRTLRDLDRLDRSIRGQTVPEDDSVQHGKWWDWFRRLLGVPFCTDIDVTGAFINPNGDIQEPNGNIISCPSGVQCDEENNLWLCS